MKIVIDIPEDAYRQIRNWGVPTDELRRKIYDIIDNGTPLPEHHGRLIDADALMKLYELEDATKYGNETAEQQTHSYDTMMMYEIADMLDDAPTIIEADECTYKETGCGSCKRQLDCPMKADGSKSE